MSSRTFVLGAVLVMAASSVAGIAIQPDAAGAVDVKKPLTINAPAITIANTAANDNMIVTFQGLTGQVVNVATTLGTFGANCNVQLSVFKPDGLTVHAGPVCGGIAGAINSVAIPTNGIYQVKIDPTGVLLGSVKVAITSTSATKSITPSAGYVTVSIPANGTVDLGFATGPPKFVAVRATAGTYASASNLQLSVVKPDNTNLVSPISAGQGTPFIDATNTTTNGVHKLRLHSVVGTAGTVKVQVWSATHVNAGAITPGGAPILVKTAVPGQLVNYTLNATNGQNLTADLANSTIPSAFLDVIRPNGTTLASRFFGTGATFVDNLQLDATGSWTVRVNSFAANVGQTDLAVDFVTGGSGSITINGPSKIATIGSAGGSVTWTVAATAGQRVTTKYSASSISSAFFVFKRPNGSAAIQPFFGTGAGFVNPFVVDVTGIWTLVIDPNGAATGSVTVELDTVTDITGTTTFGTAKTTNIIQPGQRGLYTFAGTTGQRVTITVSASTVSSAFFQVLRPNGTIPFQPFFGNGAAFIDPSQLDATGTWTLIVDPNDANTGSVTFRIDTVVDQTGSIAVGGAAVAANLLQAGKRAILSFAGSSGQTRTIQLSASSIPNAFVFLQRPNGSTITSCFFATGTTNCSPVALDATGSWKIVVDPNGGATGTANVKLT